MVFDVFSEASTVNVLGNEVAVGSIIMGVIIMAVGVVIARITSTIFKKYLTANLPDNTAKSLHKVIYYGIIIVTLLAVTTSQGIDLSGLMVAGGIFGIVIGFATQSVVSNAISGVFLMFDRPAKTGDLIEIQQSKIYGKLIDVTIFSTRIKLFDGSVMRVPNEKVFTSEIRNVSASEVRRIDATFDIGYNEDIDHAIEVIKNAVHKMPYVLLEPEPAVWVEHLADSGVSLKVLTWIPRDEWDSVGPTLLKDVKKEIENAGIEIPFPQRVIHYSDGAKKHGEQRR